MADLLEDFGTFFTVAGLATVGMLSYNTIMDTPESAIAIYEYQGMTTPMQVDGASRSIQIVVRDKVDEAAKAKINMLYKSLLVEDGIVNLTVERWTLITLRQPPFKLKVDERQLIYYCFNVGVQTYID